MPGRNGNSGDYRYGFNGKESDNEVSGNGNQYDYGFRIYNPRLGRFLSVDPLSRKFPFYSPYHFAGNKPIAALDLDGLEDIYFMEPLSEEVGELVLELLTSVEVGKAIVDEFQNVDPAKGKVNQGYDVFISSEKVEKTGASTWAGAHVKAFIGKDETTYGPNGNEIPVLKTWGELNKTEEGRASNTYKYLSFYIGEEFTKDPNFVKSVEKGRGVILVNLDSDNLKMAGEGNEGAAYGQAKLLGHEIGVHATKSAQQNKSSDAREDHIDGTGDPSGARPKEGSLMHNLNKQLNNKRDSSPKMNN